MVYVQDIAGKPLMPTRRHGWVRRALLQGRAVVVRRTPFTIRLTYASQTKTQPVSLGVDAGYKHVGISAVANGKELYAAEARLRTDMVELLSTRREARRSRRNRKTRYRKSRFLNRRRPKGWLAPSVQARIEAHLRLIRRVCGLLPVTSMAIEAAEFDMQKIQNPDIQGTEYQNGPQKGFDNVRNYVLWRDGHKCRNCGGKSKDPVLVVHHIESRKTGGNAPGNLVTLCKTCHDSHHQGKTTLQLKRTRTLRDAAVVNTMRMALLERARKEFSVPVRMALGYQTKEARIACSLAKSHAVDARCISGHPDAEPLGCLYEQRIVRRHNRQIFKAKTLKGGRRKRNQAPYLVHGFRLFDKVGYKKQECFVFGRRQTGYFVIRNLDGTVLSRAVSHKKLQLLEPRTTILTQRRNRGAIPPTAEAVGFLAPES